MENIELACARLGEDLSKIKELDEKTVNDALAVLQEQGIYAMFLYLEARGKKSGKETSTRLFEFLKETPQEKPLLQDGQDVLSAVREQLAGDLDRLLFARDLSQQALVYARYHLKSTEGRS